MVFAYSESLARDLIFGFLLSAPFFIVNYIFFASLRKSGSIFGYSYSLGQELIIIFMVSSISTAALIFFVVKKGFLDDKW